MRLILLCLFFVGIHRVYAQDVKAYGIVTYRQSPVTKVQITLFEHDSLLKKTYSDRKGKFHFRLSEKKTYVLFFYKPSFNISAYKIINRLDQELQNVFIEVQLSKSKEVQDSIFSKSTLVKSMSPSMRNDYKIVVDEYLKEKKVKAKSFTQPQMDSISEFDRQEEGETVHVYQIRIGNDVYERIVDARQQVRYMKNEKPITEVTYNFETKRRNEGVLKKEKKVKNHSRYKPLQKK
ncbi:MAG: hypothetical protein JNL95_08375 [Chitinophagales bacterium]|nr:hypothetical protein [Chitinophagales bacterium]